MELIEVTNVMKRQAASEGTERKTARNVIQSTHFNSIKLIEIEWDWLEWRGAIRSFASSIHEIKWNLIEWMKCAAKAGMN